MSVLCGSLFVIAQRCYVNETTGGSRLGQKVNLA